jgi:hypothetical protein
MQNTVIAGRLTVSRVEGVRIVAELGDELVRELWVEAEKQMKQHKFRFVLKTREGCFYWKRDRDGAAAIILKTPDGRPDVKRI